MASFDPVRPHAVRSLRFQLSWPGQCLDGVLPSSERTRSQIGRQSVRHSPWHLNSRLRPPILPPHPGQTQFRMPDITSAFLTIVVLLVICICASARKPHQRECICSSKKTQRRKNAVCISLRNREYINATKSCTLASQRDMTMYHAAVAFAVPPTLVSSSRCEGGSCFLYRLNTQSIHCS